MRLLFLALFFTTFSSYCFSQSVKGLLADAEKLESIPNETTALNKYKEVLLIDAKNLFALCKCSELSSRIGARQKQNDAKETWYENALKYANAAILISPMNDYANVVKAIALGKSSLNKGGKEKIKNVKEIKRLVDLAIKINPSNYLAWHVLGRWEYEIANVGGLERAAAKLFYSSLPNASFKNSIVYMEKTKSLAPKFVLNYIELAKAYNKNDDTKKAISILRQVKYLPISTEDDLSLKQYALRLIKSWE